MDASAFQAHAQDLVFHGSGHSAPFTEAELRRFVSSASYGLFHTLKTAGAMLFAAGGTTLAGPDAIHSLSETTVFLTALLLADRWTRRG